MKKEFNTKEERIFAGFRRFNKILKREEFGHHGKTRILNVLASTGKISQRELQDMIEITSSSISELLRKMEDHGLVVRTHDKDNARDLYVEITKEGRERAEAFNKEKAEKTKKLFAALTEEEKDQFVVMLDKIQDDWYEQGMFYGDCKRHRERQLGCR